MDDKTAQCKRCSRTPSSYYGKFHRLIGASVICSACISDLESRRGELRSRLSQLRHPNPPTPGKAEWEDLQPFLGWGALVSLILIFVFKEGAFLYITLGLFFAYIWVSTRANNERLRLMQERQRRIQEEVWRNQPEIRKVEADLSLVSRDIDEIYSNFVAKPPDWSVRVSTVHARDGHRCVRCGRHMHNSRVPFHTHHIIPRAKGGTHALENLVTLCEICHSKEPGSGHARVKAARRSRLDKARGSR